MQQIKQPATTTTKAPLPSPPPSIFGPGTYPQYHYGTFSPPPLPSQPPVVNAASQASAPGFGGQGVAATSIPYAVQQQVFVEGVPVLATPLPFCGVGIGWFLFLLGFFLAAIPWYAGAFLLFFVAMDHREKPGLIACTIAGIFALVPFILNGIRMQPFW